MKPNEMPDELSKNDTTTTSTNTHTDNTNDNLKDSEQPIPTVVFVGIIAFLLVIIGVLAVKKKKHSTNADTGKSNAGMEDEQ
jgi:hypothetical protein